MNLARKSSTKVVAYISLLNFWRLFEVRQSRRPGVSQRGWTSCMVTKAASAGAFCLASYLIAALLGSQAVSAQPQVDSSAALLAKASQLRQSAPDQADSLLTSLLAQEPDNLDVLTTLALLRVDQGRQKEAATLLRKALLISPNASAANQVLGDLLLSQHRLPEAMEHFETILSVSLSDQPARAGERAASIQLALDARRKHRQDAAMACLEHAVEHLPDDPVLLTDLGIEAQSMHQLPRAAEVLEQALHLAPGNPDALYALAHVEFDQQHLPEAETHFRAYLALKPEDASAHFGLGRLLSMELRTGEAQAEFARSLALQPVQTESYYQLGEIELNAHHDAAARSLFQKVIDRDPKHGGALTGLGTLAYRAKDFSAAESYLARATESSPDYQPAHYYYGLTLGQLGKSAASQAELKRAGDLASHLHAEPLFQEPPAPQN